ncbi:MAG: Uma2 family endonuclease [Bacteroidetes bacterium]|nr:MAG: Uma2 family endonuclease [Bacteroidota bacterium]
MITDISQLNLNGRYTYADYLTWQFDEMVELIRGKIFRMSPAPNTGHQHLSGDLYGQIWSHLKGQSCKAFHAPFDVRLPLPEAQQLGDKVDTVVQPDLCVVCDLTKLDRRGCQGPPDWVIEILSPSTAHKDLHEKFDLYQNAGVPEYWVVFPFERSVVVYHRNEEGRYQAVQPQPFTAPGTVTSLTFPALNIDLGALFEGLGEEDF